MQKHWEELLIRSIIQLVYYRPTDKYRIKQNNKSNQYHWVPSPLGLLVSLNNNKYAWECGVHVKTRSENV